jgi:hypothetical protein
MPDQKPSRAPAKGERSEKPRTDDASDHDPKGTPTKERHNSETASGQHKHHEPHTTGHPAGGEREKD